VQHSASMGASIDMTSPAFEQVTQNIAQIGKTDFGSSSLEALAHAQQIILGFMHNNVFIQSIGDCLLLAGVITFFSAIPLFFLSRK
jgi:hypothetical protein